MTARKGLRWTRRIGVAGEYYQDVAGNWYTLNPQTGFVPVPASSRGLRLALDNAPVKEAA